MKENVDRLVETKENLENTLSELSNNDADIMETINYNNEYK